MNGAVSEILEFVKENDIKFIRLGFCDLFGFQKNISIVSEELPSAFENGVLFDAHAIKGFRDVTESDLLLFPAPETLAILPWRPGTGRVARFFCDIKNPDATPFHYDTRNLLKEAENRCQEMGYFCKIGAECEFYLFKTDENGEPTETPLDKGGYFDISPLDKGENIRREICLTLDEMGITPECSHHERGPGQNEIDFKFGGALNCADNLLNFKSVVKAIASRNGLYASFMPKPIPQTAGNGLHVNISLIKNGVNIFRNIEGGQSNAAESFIAGILSKTPEMTLFLNPIVNSYERFGEFEAPKFVSWSHQNRSQLVRIPAASGEKVRMELRSPDPSLNPYFAFALIMSAGLDGIENGLTLPAPLNIDLYSANEDLTKNLVRLPASLKEAISLAQNSPFVKNIVGEELLLKYITIKKNEVTEFDLALTDKAKFYKERFFDCV
ncbi:MAG: glutamine synthetase family protein [Chitinispirillales bacterium]|jgi:glutamine synthetase|nr:glutamine synthetase family protein [Chitinispirillales bacterium]